MLTYLIWARVIDQSSKRAGHRSGRPATRRRRRGRCDIPFGGASARPGAHYMHPHEIVPQVLGERNYAKTTAELAHHAGVVLLR